MPSFMSAMIVLRWRQLSPASSLGLLCNRRCRCRRPTCLLAEWSCYATSFSLSSSHRPSGNMTALTTRIFRDRYCRFKIQIVASPAKNEIKKWNTQTRWSVQWAIKAADVIAPNFTCCLSLGTNASCKVLSWFNGSCFFTTVRVCICIKYTVCEYKRCYCQQLEAKDSVQQRAAESVQL